jgi:glycosyltransferase involved in cell wall biosynthesis/putative flippase GtrA
MSHDLVNRVNTLVKRHRVRFAIFGVIGGGIFATGLVLQAMLVQICHLDAVFSYVTVGIVSIQVSFILNHQFTWRDRSVPFWIALYRFNAQKAITTVINLLAYSALVKLGVNYLAANVLTVTAFTLINYGLGNSWSFAAKKRVPVSPAESPPPPARTPGTALPTVSVVVPCRNNADTIRPTVESLLRQDYPALEELILVGSVADPTWDALEGITDPRLVILEQEAVPGKRDPAIKRDTALQKARGELLALADSDIVMEPDWLSQAIPLLISQGGGCVAGGMRSIRNNFWGRFVDRNVLSAKTPRTPAPYQVHRRNFGRRGTKPPITANVVFTRDVYDDCQFNRAWTSGYEDYEWFWRIACAGHSIHVSNVLDGRHHHRRSFRQLVKEYLRSSDGCARFIRAHPDAPLARKRLLQGIFLPIACLALLAMSSTAIWLGYGEAIAFGAALTLATLTGREFGKSRTLESLAYPVISLALCLVFAAGLSMGLIRVAMRGAGVHTLQRPSDTRRQTPLLR